MKLNDLNAFIGHLVQQGCEPAVYTALTEYSKGRLIGMDHYSGDRFTAADLPHRPEMLVEHIIVLQKSERGLVAVLHNVDGSDEDVTTQDEWMHILLSAFTMFSLSTPKLKAERLTQLFGQTQTYVALLIGRFGTMVSPVMRSLLIHPDLTADEARQLSATALVLISQR